MSSLAKRPKRLPSAPAKPEDAMQANLERIESDIGPQLTPEQKIIGDDETFRQWCERLGRDGLMVDNSKPFRLDNRPAMAWVYDQVPSTVEEAYRYTLILMKCSQVGFTTMEMLATIYLGIKFGPATVGMFLPDMNLAEMKSTERFIPIVRTIPAVHSLMTVEASAGAGRKSGEGNVRRRRIGESLYVFSWTSGRATTESIPMDILTFDEVQEMTLGQMEKTRERLSASSIRFTMMGSTANWPDLDIHHWYKRGTQHRFHTACPTCGVRKPLDDYFPECIRYDPEEDDHRYVCEAGHWIDDPQLGEWIADSPDAAAPTKKARMVSIHFPQFLSPDMSPGEIIDSYNNATDLKSFHNRKLGRPYLDPSQMPVTLEHMANCVAAGAAAGVQWKKGARNTFMGIDQMGNFNVVVIKERLPDNRQAVIHLEEIYSTDPFGRCDELMEAYGVQCCVLEINPNYNEAKAFSQRFPGRVFICNSFGSLKDDMIAWGDRSRLNASDRRTDEGARDRYTLGMDQFKCMQVSLARFTAKEPTCLFPDPKGLVQEVIDKKVRKVEPIAPRAFHHFTKTALVSERESDKDRGDGTNKYTRKVRKVGIDPHFSYANMLCDVAWSRAHGTASFILPEAGSAAEARWDGEEDDGDGYRPQIEHALGHLMEPQPTGLVCGRCVSRPLHADGTSPKSWRCRTRALGVQEGDFGCDYFVPRS